jgi:D-alanyl-D-alanine carboxypeptidase
MRIPVGRPSARHRFPPAVAVAVTVAGTWAAAMALTACGSSGAVGSGKAADTAHSSRVSATAGPAENDSGESGESGNSGESAPPTDDVDGYLPEGRHVTPADERYSAIRNLDKPLLKALQKADGDAKHDSITMWVTSGWRSRKHQQSLLNDAIRQYGTLEKAREFVNTPEKSAHVSGKAVDIGPTDADDWLIQHGSAYGLCQVYANEMWHFELRTTPGGTCPAQLTDAAG